MHYLFRSRVLCSTCKAIIRNYNNAVGDSLAQRAVKLAFSSFQDTNICINDPPLIIIHGLFGSKKNWEALAKVFNKTGRKVLTVDARNHGESPHTAEMDYHLMADDVELLMKDLNISKAIILGHSMGGKIAMTLALTRPHLVSRLIVEDVAPQHNRVVMSTGFPEYVSAMQQVSFSPELQTLSQARRETDVQLQNIFTDKQVRNFITTNVDTQNDHFGWRFNLESIHNNLKAIVGFPHFESCYNGDAFFLGGSESPYISEDDTAEILWLFPEARIEHIQGAGHWVHSDMPTKFVERVQQFLLEVS